MTKATKTTRKRLATEDFTPYVRLSTLIETIINQAEQVENGWAYDRAIYTDDGLFYQCYENEKPLFRGFETRYPKLIETTLTHGLNQIKIPDVNKFVKTMLQRKFEGQ